MIGGHLRPADVHEVQAIIARLCKLQRNVVEMIDPQSDHPTDCFCGESGFWPLRSPRDFRNDLTAIEFIEETVRARLYAVTTVTP